MESKEGLKDEELEYFITTAVGSSDPPYEVIESVNNKFKTSYEEDDITIENWQHIENMTIYCADCGWWVETGMDECICGHEDDECGMLC